MADFETLASDTSERLNLLVEESENSGPLLEEVTGRFSQETSTIESLWATTESTSQALLSRLSAVRQQQADFYTQAMQSISQLSGTVTAINAQVDEQAALTQQQLTTLSGVIESASTDIITSTAAIQEQTETLKAQATEAETQAAALFAELEKEFEESSELVQSHIEEISSNTQRVEEFLVSEASEKLTSKMQELDSQISDAVSKADEHLSQLAEEANSKSDEIISKAKEDHEAFEAEVESTAGDTQQNVQKTGEAISQVTGTFSSARTTLSEGVKLTNTGFDTAVGALKEVQKILDSF